MANKEVYLKILARLMNSVSSEWPKFWENLICMLHHGNGPTRAWLLILKYLAEDQNHIVPHLLHCREQSLAHYFLALKLKTTFKGCRFRTIEKIQNMREQTFAPSKKEFSRWLSETWGSNGNGVFQVEGTGVKVAVLRMLHNSIRLYSKSWRSFLTHLLCWMNEREIIRKAKISF